MSNSLSLSSTPRSPVLTGLSATTFSWRLHVVDVVSILTFLQCIYLTFASDNRFQYAVLIKCLLLVILWPSFRRSCFLWLCVVLIWLPTLLLEWCSHEDHVYFTLYWCAALALATWKPVAGAARSAAQSPGSEAWHADTEAFLRRSARYLIGLCFLFATVWKIVSPEFTDGSLFHYKLLFDDRFSETLARFPGEMSVPAIEENYLQLTRLRAPGSVATAAPIELSPRISWLATGMTWWTIAIEGFLAVTFLWPAAGRPLRLIRNLALAVFALSTYAVAPVMGYGFTLMILGYANCEDEERKMRSLFLGSLFLLVLILVFRDSLVPSEIRDFHQAVRSANCQT